LPLKDSKQNKNEILIPLMVLTTFLIDFGGFRLPPDPETLGKMTTALEFGILWLRKWTRRKLYDFYQKSDFSPDFKRFIAIEIQHAKSSTTDSYAVNSEQISPLTEMRYL